MFGTYCRLNVHVSASNMDVIRVAKTRLKRRAQTGREHREMRHGFYKAMLREHAGARKLYTQVMQANI